MTMHRLVQALGDQLIVVGDLGRGVCVPEDQEGRQHIEQVFPDTTKIYLRDFRSDIRGPKLLEFYRVHYADLAAVCLLGTDTWELTLPYLTKWYGDVASGRLDVKFIWGETDIFVLKVDSGWNLPPSTRQHRLQLVANWFQLERKLRGSTY